MDAIVLTFDCLPVGFLGCYGSERSATPAFDRLAAEGCVFAQCFTDRTDQQRPDSWWSPDSSLNRSPTDNSIIAQLQQAGIQTCLIVEAPEGQVAGDFPDFNTRTEVDGIDGWEAEEFETPFAQLMAAAARQILAAIDGNVDSNQSSRERRLFWLASRGITEPWIPPAEFGSQLLEILDDDEDESDPADEDEPDSDVESDMPADANRISTLFADTDADADADEDAELREFLNWICSGGRRPLADTPPDQIPTDSSSINSTALDEAPSIELTSEEWQLSRAACVAYVQMLDHWLGVFFDQLGVHRQETLFIVTAGRGIRLNEHDSPQGNHSPLCEANLHVPMLMAGPGIDPAQRQQALVQPSDLAVTLQDWFGIPKSAFGRSLIEHLGESPAENRQVAISRHTSDMSCVRTEHELFIPPIASLDAHHETTASTPAGSTSPQLYLKPSDTWEWLNVADQFPDRVARLARASRRIDSAIECQTIQSLDDLNQLFQEVDSEAATQSETREPAVTQSPAEKPEPRDSIN